jgi:hypothetical protein
MVILETNDPNFVIEKDLILKTEKGETIHLSGGEYVELAKLESGEIYLSNCAIIGKDLQEKLFSYLKNVSHIQVEDLQTNDLNVDGKVLKEYINDSFDIDSYQFALVENIILNDSRKVISIN